jgi:hypothetical protein
VKLKNPYPGVRKIFGTYWAAYGGFAALLWSPYLHFTFVLLAVTFKFWTVPGWWDTVIGILPNILGFTLGGFAIFIGFGDEKFRSLLAEPDEEDPDRATVYVGLCATFVHFILVQILALLVALVAKSWWFYAPWMCHFQTWLPYLNGIGGALGYGIFLYAMSSVVAATMHVFRISTMYEKHQRVTAQRADDEGPR